MLQKRNHELLSQAERFEDELKSSQLENERIKTTLRHKKQMLEHNVSAMFAVAAIESKEHDENILIDHDEDAHYLEK